MAKIHEEVIVITLSKLIKDNETETAQIASEDVVSALASVAEELLGSGVIVEANKA